LHGSYALIRCGLAYEAMIDLTGAPFEKIYFSDANFSDDTLFRKILKYDQQEQLMSVSTPGEDRLTEGERAVVLGQDGKCVSGLVPGHAYSLISAREPKYGPPGLRSVLSKYFNCCSQIKWT
jgi:hypothetical protein